MMRIEHIAIWTSDLEGIRDFYQSYFSMKCSDKYDELVKSQQKLVNMRLRHCILKTYRYYS